jgi:hypothetical protein
VLAVRSQLRDEPVAAVGVAIRVGVEGAGSGGEVGGARRPREVDAPVSSHRDACAVEIASAQVRRERDILAVRCELRDEGVGPRAAVPDGEITAPVAPAGRVERLLDRKVERCRLARDVHVARPVRHHRADVPVGAAPVRREREHRVNDDGPRAVVGRDVDSHGPAPIDDEAARDSLAPPRLALVDHRRVLADDSLADVDAEAAVRLPGDLLRAPVVEPYPARIRPRRDDEVVLQLPVTSVQDEVDARVGIAKADAAERRHACPPASRIGPDQVVARPAERILGDRVVETSALEAQTESGDA